MRRGGADGEDKTMAAPILRFAYGGVLFSPFTGCSLDPEKLSAADASVLFVFDGMAGEYTHVSPRLRRQFGADVEEMDIHDLIRQMAVPGAIVFEVDADWNAVTYYGFAPLESQ